VALILILTNTYFVGSPSQGTVKIQDSDSPTVVTVANVEDPVGIDYSPTINSLLLSVNADANGLPNNFARLGVLGGHTVLTNWSAVSNFTGEIKLATVKTTANGWTQGDMYFGTGQPGQIGWVSANGTSVNTNWLTLSGEPNPIGGLYIDQTGVFGGDLIVVSGASTFGGGVWRITAAKGATKVAQINDSFGDGVDCEGVVTVPNNQAQYGPWAGNILTCGETAHLIFAVDVSGKITPYDLGLFTPEDVRLIPSGQNLYCTDAVNFVVWKVPQGNFSGFVGDVLFVNEAINSPNALFIAHWTGGAFVMRQLSFGGSFEHVAFAPIDIPGQ